MQRLVRYKLEPRCWHARGGCVIHRCQNKNPRLKGWPVDMNDVIHRKRVLGILKKSVELRTRLRTGRVNFRGSLRPDKFVYYGHHTWWGGKWKSHHRKIVHLSSLCRNLKLKGNKRFRTWTKKSLCVFRVSGFLCSMYICYEHSMYVSHIHVWVCYKKKKKKKIMLASTF